MTKTRAIEEARKEISVVNGVLYAHVESGVFTSNVPYGMSDREATRKLRTERALELLGAEQHDILDYVYDYGPGSFREMVYAFEK